MFGLSRDAVKRHGDSHIRPAVLRVAESREEITQQGIVSDLLTNRERARRALDRAEEAGDGSAIARLLKEDRETTVYLAKTIGMYGNGPSSVTDNRTQLVVFEKMPLEEIRAHIKALSAPPDGPATDGEPDSGKR